MVVRPINRSASPAGDIDVETTSTFPGIGGVQFKLNDLPADKILAWSNLYEQIKLTGVKVTWIPPADQVNATVPWSDTGSPQNLLYPALHAKMACISDPDDASLPTYQQLSEYARRHQWTGPRSKSLFIRVKFPQFIATGIARPIASPWLDAQNSTGLDIPLNGFKYAIPDNSNLHWPEGNFAETTDPRTGSNHPFGEFQFTYYVACRRTVHSVAPVVQAVRE